MRPEQRSLFDLLDEESDAAATTVAAPAAPAPAEPEDGPSAPAPVASGPAPSDRGGRAGSSPGAPRGAAPPLDAAALLAPWRAAGVLSAADVHLAATLARLAGLGDGTEGLASAEQLIVLAAALAARAPRLGHVCLDLATVAASAPAEVEGDADELAAADVDALPWPDDIDGWRAAVASSSLVTEVVDGRAPPSPAGRGVPLVLDGTLLYLERYRVYEDDVATELVRRAATPAPGQGAAPAVAASAFAGALRTSPEQARAAEAGASGLLSVIVGGPGTGKTTTVATLLALLLEADPTLRVALVAPTGKAAARMGESIAELAASVSSGGRPGAEALAERLAAAEVSTVHRRLGARGDGTFRHHRGQPLVHDVVIVDETSMVSLPLMAHLLEAVRPEARLVLVGDPGQLASVEAGSVLGDIAGPAVDAALTVADPAIGATAGADGSGGALAGCVHVLTESYRFPAGSPVGRFAAAVRSGRADEAVAVLTGAGTSPTSSQAVDPVEPVEPVEPVDAGVVVRWHPDGADTDAGCEAVRGAALAGAARTLQAAEDADAAGALGALEQVRVLCAHRRGPFGVAAWNWRFEQWLADDGRLVAGWYPGRPVLVTANDQLNDLANGDMGVVVATDDGPRVAFPGAAGVRLLGPARLDAVDTVHAMTIHKSQGSEFDEVVVVLPPEASRLATRELLYTAVTRARRAVTLVGSEAALRRAVTNRVVRQSGLRARLWPGG